VQGPRKRPLSFEGSTATASPPTLKRMSRKLGVTVLCACALVAAGVANGYVTAGRAWPDGVITYYNAAPDQAWAVERAVQAWNTSGAHVRFVPAGEQYAEVRIQHWDGVACTVNAEATIGYARQARIWIFNRDDSSAYCNRFFAARTLTHELGHVLGLGHETHGCATMNPVNTLQGSSKCGKTKLWQWRCRLLTSDDIAGAVALYGGTARTLRGQSACDLYAGVRPPTDLTVAPTTVPYQFRIRFRRPPSVTVPGFLSAQRNDKESFVAGASTEGCPAEPYKFSRVTWDAVVGGMEDTYLTLPAGVSCVSVWAVDSFARPSSKPATYAVKVLPASTG